MDNRTIGVVQHVGRDNRVLRVGENALHATVGPTLGQSESQKRTPTPKSTNSTRETAALATPNSAHLPFQPPAIVQSHEHDMLSDLRNAARLLLRSRGFAAMAILTLALGIGANSAVFAVLNSIVLKPPPFPEPNRILRIRGLNELRGWTNGYGTMPDIDDFREQSNQRN